MQCTQPLNISNRCTLAVLQFSKARHTAIYGVGSLDDRSTSGVQKHVEACEDGRQKTVVRTYSSCTSMRRILFLDEYVNTKSFEKHGQRSEHTGFLQPLNMLLFCIVLAVRNPPRTRLQLQSLHPEVPAARNPNRLHQLRAAQAQQAARWTKLGFQNLLETRRRREGGTARHRYSTPHFATNLGTIRLDKHWH